MKKKFPPKDVTLRNANNWQILEFCFRRTPFFETGRNKSSKTSVVLKRFYFKWEFATFALNVLFAILFAHERKRSSTFIYFQFCYHNTTFCRFYSDGNRGKQGMYMHVRKLSRRNWLIHMRRETHLTFHFLYVYMYVCRSTPISQFSISA